LRVFSKSRRIAADRNETPETAAAQAFTAFFPLHPVALIRTLA
jgi:hypothetical protein